MADQPGGNSPKEPLAPIWVGLAIWLFFPLGLFLLWHHPHLGKNGKWWASGIAWACFIMFMGSRAEEDGPPVVDSSTAKPSETVEAPGGSAPSAKKKSRKMPKMENKRQDPDERKAYEEGWMEGVAMGHEWLDRIESEAPQITPSKFLKTHPEMLASIEEQRMSLMKAAAQSTQGFSAAAQALASRGVSEKSSRQDPQVLAALKQSAFMFGKSDGFVAVVNPVIFHR